MKTTITRAPDGMLTYAYGDNEFTCHYHTLAEVGEPWQPECRTIIADEEWRVETRELDHAPWVADFATTMQ